MMVSSSEETKVTSTEARPSKCYTVQLLSLDGLVPSLEEPEFTLAKVPSLQIRFGAC